MSYLDLRDVKMKELPPKKPGRHRFIAMTTYIISEEAIRGGMDGTEQVYFDQENIWDVSFGCIDCEQPWKLGMKKMCLAPEYIDPNKRGQSGG